MVEEEAVEMFVGGLVLDPNNQAPVVVLKDEGGEINLPIWIGIAEATAIASVLKNLEMARPLTHDLMSQVLDLVDVSLERVLITELRDSTYYAELWLRYGQKAITVDARPSDALALALRAEAPIYVAKEVLTVAQGALLEGAESEQVEESEADSDETEAVEEVEQAAGKDFRNIEKDKWDELLSNLNADDFKYKM